MKRIPKWSVAGLGLLVVMASLGQRQQRLQGIDQLFDELRAVRRFKEVAISPEGSRVAWVETLVPSEQYALYVLEWKSPGASPRRVSAGDGKNACAERGLAWSPDGTRLAFLSDCEKKGQLQLYVTPAGGGRSRKLTSLTGYLAEPSWSPNGLQLACLFTENAPRAAGPLEAVTPDSGVVEEHIFHQRIAVVDVSSGRVRQVSPPGLYVYEYDWSPDSRNFVVTAAPGPGDNNWYIAQLYTLPLDSGRMQPLFSPPLQIAVPRWSPDGKTIAFIGGLMSDEGFTGGDVFTIAAAGGEAQNRTPGRKSSPSWIGWLSPDQLLLTEHIDGGSQISRMELASERIETLWTGEEDVHAAGERANFSLARNGRTSAVIRQSWRQPPEIWAGPADAWQQITHLNRERRPNWGEAKSLHWTSDAFRVQGWLLYPRDFDPARRRYPMVVSVHGGPANMKKPAWPDEFFDMAAFSQQGYFVFFPNPRGSYGQGEAFTRANVKDFGGGDLRDILAGVDEVLKSAPVDPSRIGIAGWSYGGYMTMWTVTQTNRFRAAVAGAGIANWQSYYGENAIDKWMPPYFGASVYEDPAVYAKSSPIQFIKQVKTPTLVLVGERDGECPPPQSYEFWRALKILGINTQLVVYTGEGHQFHLPDDRRDVTRRAIGWFEEWLGGN